MKQRRKKPSITTSFTLALMGILSLFALSGMSKERQDFAPVAARAEQVFEFDRYHPNVIPANHVRALSMTVAFHDRDGTLKLLSEIEPLSGASLSRN